MARPNKEGLDYFSLDTDITGDDKIKIIKAKHGLVGFAIVILLLTKIYKEGYYYHWNEDEQYLFADDARVDLNAVTAVVNDCINKGFFHQKLYQEYGILTSRGIQKRFLQACTRRKKLTLVREYFIVDDYLKEVFEGKKVIVSFNFINADINPTKPELVSAEIPQIEIEIEREKEIERESNAREGELVDNFSPDDFLEGTALSEGSVRNAPDTDVNGEVAAASDRDPDFVSFWSVYPKHTSMSIALEAWNTLMTQGVKPKYLILAASKYATKMKAEGQPDQFIKNAHNFLLQGVYRDYLPIQVTQCPQCKEHYRCKGQEWFWHDEPDGRGGTKQVTVICPYKAGVQSASIGA